MHSTNTRNSLNLMKEYSRHTAAYALLFALLIVSVSGCAGMKMKDGELYLNSKTSASIEDGRIAKVTNHF